MYGASSEGVSLKGVIRNPASIAAMPAPSQAKQRKSSMKEMPGRRPKASLQLEPEAAHHGPDVAQPEPSPAQPEPRAGQPEPTHCGMKSPAAKLDTLQELSPGMLPTDGAFSFDEDNLYRHRPPKPRAPSKLAITKPKPSAAAIVETMGSAAAMDSPLGAAAELIAHAVGRAVAEGKVKASEEQAAKERAAARAKARADAQIPRQSHHAKRVETPMSGCQTPNDELSVLHPVAEDAAPKPSAPLPRAHQRRIGSTFGSDSFEDSVAAPSLLPTRKAGIPDVEAALESPVLPEGVPPLARMPPAVLNRPKHRSLLNAMQCSSSERPILTAPKDVFAFDEDEFDAVRRRLPPSKRLRRLS